MLEVIYERRRAGASRASITLLRGRAASFPPGTKFFDVEGLPVAITPKPDGGSDCRAFDTSPPRPFTRGSVSRNGAEVSREAFDPLRSAFLPLQKNPPEWAQQFCDALNRGVLKNIPTN